MSDNGFVWISVAFYGLILVIPGSGFVIEQLKVSMVHLVR